MRSVVINVDYEKFGNSGFVSICVDSVLASIVDLLYIVFYETFASLFVRDDICYIRVLDYMFVLDLYKNINI